MNTAAINYLRTYPIVKFEKGDYIFRSFSEMHYVYFLDVGRCMRLTNTDSGEEIFFNEKEADGSANALLGSLNVYTSARFMMQDFVATENCLTHRLTVDEFHHFARQFPAVLEELLYQAMSDYSSLALNFLAKQKGMAAPRVADFILEHAMRRKNDARLLEKRFTSAEIARYLAMHRITVNKIVLALIEANALTRTPEGLVLVDERLLRKYADGSEKLDYKKKRTK